MSRRQSSIRPHIYNGDFSRLERHPERAPERVRASPPSRVFPYGAPPLYGPYHVTCVSPFLSEQETFRLPHAACKVRRQTMKNHQIFAWWSRSVGPTEFWLRRQPVPRVQSKRKSKSTYREGPVFARWGRARGPGDPRSVFFYFL